MIATSILMLFLCKKREMNTGSMQLLIEDLMLGISLTGSSLVSLKASDHNLEGNKMIQHWLAIECGTRKDA